MNRFKQAGFTAVELLIFVWAAVVVGIFGAVIAVLWHFISKFW